MAMVIIITSNIKCNNSNLVHLPGKQNSSVLTLIQKTLCLPHQTMG